MDKTKTSLDLHMNLKNKNTTKGLKKLPKIINELMQ
jgi:hypothetical protein